MIDRKVKLVEHRKDTKTEKLCATAGNIRTQKKNKKH